MSDLECCPNCLGVDCCTWAAEQTGPGPSKDREYRAAHDDGYRMGVTDGERMERAAIVAWLHMQEGRHTFGDLARAIEGGEHTWSDDE